MRIPLIISIIINVALALIIKAYYPKIEQLHTNNIRLQDQVSTEAGRAYMWSTIALASVETYGVLSKNGLGYNQRTFRINGPHVRIAPYGGTLGPKGSFGIVEVSPNTYEFYVSGNID